MMYLDIPYITFMTTENTAVFGQNLKAVLFVAMPLFLIWLATEFAGQFISVIRNSFRRNKVDDDRDYERDYDK